MKDYDIKCDQKIGFRDLLLAGKGESRTPGIQEPTEDPNYDPQKKVSLLPSERDNFQKIDRLENKIEPIEFDVAQTVTRLLSSEREPEVMENHEKDFDEEPSSPQSALQIDEREERVISPELPS